MRIDQNDLLVHEFFCATFSFSDMVDFVLKFRILFMLVKPCICIVRRSFYCTILSEYFSTLDEHFSIAAANSKKLVKRRYVSKTTDFEVVIVIKVIMYYPFSTIPIF